jgi:hypothetical protein
VASGASIATTRHLAALGDTLERTASDTTGWSHHHPTGCPPPTHRYPHSPPSPVTLKMASPVVCL